MTKSAFSLVAACSLLLLTGEAHAQSLTLSSPDIKEGATIANEQVFKGFGCTGKNISPALNWSGAPAGTKSFAVTMYDPDAPTGSGWWHWVVFNIPPSVTSLPKGAGNRIPPVVTSLAKGAGYRGKALMPRGAVQSRTDFGTEGYGGPCPPPGEPHHYQITVYAVDVAALPNARHRTATAAAVGFDLHSHTLAKATLTGLYGR